VERGVSLWKGGLECKAGHCGRPPTAGTDKVSACGAEERKTILCTSRLTCWEELSSRANVGSLSGGMLADSSESELKTEVMTTVSLSAHCLTRTG